MIDRLKKIIKFFIYPILFYKNKKKFRIFYGKYQRYDDIKNYTNYNTSASLNNINDEIEIKIVDYKNFYKNKSNDRSQITNQFSLLISLIDKRNISILDYGGGAGSTFLDIYSSINLKNYNYYIYDLPNVLEIGKKLIKNENVFFINNLNATSNFDVIYIGSTLQYLKNYKSILKQLINKNPKYFFITDNFYTKEQSFLTLQINMPPRKIPYRIYDISEIIKFFKHNKYSLIYNSKNYQPIHEINNNMDFNVITDSINLLFKKNY